MQLLLENALAKFELQRLPRRKNEQLRAWDAADEYLLQNLSENQNLTVKNQMLILNDQFGALTVALHEFEPIAISDSFLSHQATRENLINNGLSVNKVQLRNSLDWPDQTLSLILIKVPKTLALLEDQLIQLQPLLTEKTTIIAAGMIKSMPSSVWKLFEQYLGPTRPSLARKKARLIFITLNGKRQSFKNPYPVYYQLENSEFQISNHANVFSRERLDIGTRFLLNHLPHNIKARDIVDLGCGNGVVGLKLAQIHSSAKLYFVDESYMAIASAKENFYHAFASRNAEFLCTDGLSDFKKESIDLIVCNPPFHQQHTIGKQIAFSMFKGSRRVLRSGGELWVIGNRHLAYHIDLKKIFTQCKTMVANNKFVIWKVTK